MFALPGAGSSPSGSSGRSSDNELLESATRTTAHASWQTLQEWQETLQEIITLSPEHISAYSLTPAENTTLYEALKNKTLTLPPDELDREMYHLARATLADAGYAQYEISNFAKPGRESRHNINCWKRVPYIGFGLGAHSFDGSSRWNNTENMTEYLKNQKSVVTDSRFSVGYKIQPTEYSEFNYPTQKKENICHLSEADALYEEIILSLRLMEGISKARIPPQFIETVQKLIVEGLLVEQSAQNTPSSPNICLTPRGMDLANRVFAAFL